MNDSDKQIIEEFILESREHLQSIEEDLLAIESAGNAGNADLLNKVFRAAHSIKGGAGFLEFKTIQELAHKIESILDRMRTGGIAPSPEVINILLLAFDQLKDLVIHYKHSNQADISEISISLTGLLSSFLAPARKKELQESVTITNGRGDWKICVPRYDMVEASSQGQYVYLIEVDLIADIESKGKRPWDLISELNSAGNILACEINLAAVGSLDDDEIGSLLLQLVYSSIVGPEFVDGLTEGIPTDAIHTLLEPDAEVPATLCAELLHAPQPDMGADAQRPAAPVTQVPPADIPAATSPPPADAAPLSTALSSEKAAVSPALRDSGRMSRIAKDSGDPATDGHTDTQPDETLRVSVRLLENLVTMAGEMVLGRNQLKAAIDQADLTHIQRSGQRLSTITSDMQEAIMRMRMQPIGNVLTKFTRIVRDLARNSGKQVQLEIIGKEVELDKAIIEGINDPLTHMVRNSVDHGIETPGERIHAGKPESGHILLNAYHSAGQVVIEIGDDGRGMDPRKIAAAAVRKGQISAEFADSLTDREKLELIFLPGLSTAETVSDLSGRGVGMDVVKTNINRLGGKIEIESEPGKGSLLRIYLPLTLAIMPSLLVVLGDERYAIAQAHVQELIHIPAAEVRSRIQAVGNQHALLFREKLIPAVRLRAVLGMSDPSAGSQQPLNAVIIQSGPLSYALIVDGMQDTQEIVVRPLGRHFRNCSAFAGATILGNGQVAVILDVAGIADKAAFKPLSEDVGNAAESTDSDHMDGAELMQLLVYHHSAHEPCAIPLQRILRLEEIAASQVETRGGVRAMQYRKHQLPLVSLDEVAKVDPLPVCDRYLVMVIRSNEGEFGILGTHPVDLVKDYVTLDDSHRQNGVTGAFILQEQTTLLLDVGALNPARRKSVQLLQAAGDTRSASRDAASAQRPASPTSSIPDDATSTEAQPPAGTILLAEDSGFFRNQLVTLLQDAGFKVFSAEDGAAAYELLLTVLPEVDLVLTDIEMPRLDGLGLTRKIRENPQALHLPVIAITTLADEADIQRGISAGVTEYQIKLDRDALLAAIHRWIS